MIVRICTLCSLQEEENWLFLFNLIRIMRMLITLQASLIVFTDLAKQFFVVCIWTLRQPLCWTWISVPEIMLKCLFMGTLQFIKLLNIYILLTFHLFKNWNKQKLLLEDMLFFITDWEKQGSHAPQKERAEKS